MLRLVSFLFTGCWHEWEILNRVKVYNKSFSNDIPVNFDYELQCKKCGNIKKKRI